MKQQLLIAPNYLKKEILKKYSAEKKLCNLKIINKEEFIDNYCGKINPKSLYLLMKKFNLNYGTAKKYLQNIHLKSEIITPYYVYLKENAMIEENPLFKEKYHDITVAYSDVEPYILKEIKNVKFLENSCGSYTPNVYEFQTQTDELTFIAEDIIEKLKKVNINNIFIAGITDDYKSEFIRIFNLFKIPFNLEKANNCYSTQEVQHFLNSLKKDLSIQETLENIENGDIKNKIIDKLNKLNLPDALDEVSIEIIKNELKTISLDKETVSNAVQIISINEINDPNNYYYIAGLNEGVIPHIYKDDDIISDKEKIKIDVLTSTDKNKIEKDKIKFLIKSIPNLTISYKQKDLFKTYYPSSIISELNLNIIKDYQKKYNYSNNYNKFSLVQKLDNYFNYNEKDSALDILYSNYQNTEILNYSNSYTQINTESLKKYLKNHLTLSYTSLNNYALCPFKFYAKNILKLEPYEETFPILIGNLFHFCLSKMYEKEFDLEKEYYSYLKNKNLNSKEKFYINKLFSILKNDIDVIKWQETHTTYSSHLTEKKIEINKSKEIKITFTGIIDKLNYIQKDNINCIIIDYKTGDIKTSLDNINYGLNMQLPTYIYLIQKGLGPKYSVDGFYLQKILTKPSLDETDYEKQNKNNLKLNGYTIDDENIISQIDETYQNSEIISSMKQTKNGFSSYTKIISKNEINYIKKLVEKNLDNTIDKILKADFKIEPKRIEKDISCKNCPFKDLCFVKEENIKDLKNTKFEDILGGEENAKLD